MSETKPPRGLRDLALAALDRVLRLVGGAVLPAADLAALRKDLVDERRALHAFMDNLPDHIFLKDARSRLVRSNEAHVKALGFTDMREVVGKTDFDLFPPELARGYYEEEQAVMRGERQLVGKINETPQQDGMHWLSESKVPVRDEHGAVVGLVGISRDVTDLVRAEEKARSTGETLARANASLVENQQALEGEMERRRAADEAARRERDLLNALIDGIPDLVAFKDAAGAYTRVNAAQARALGVAAPREAVGRKAADFHSPEFARTAEEDEREVLRSGRPLVGRMEHDERSGIHLLTTKVPLRDAQGRVVGLVGISKDVTEHRRAEERLQREMAAFFEVVSAVAGGDLTIRGREGADTLGRIAASVNGMLLGFGRMVSDVRAVALTVSSSSSQILASSRRIAEGAADGSDQVLGVSSSVEEMAASMTRVSRHAEFSAETAREALDHLRQGERSLADAHEGIARIDAAVSATAEKMRTLGRRSQEVLEITDVIDEIAEQSKLLSLNAAIEAAHAGKAGLGFGVVAEEIRRLAESSTEATRGAAAVITGMVDEIRAALAAMEGATREVAQGRALSDEARRSLAEIESRVQRATQLAEEISGASREQSSATLAVAKAMQRIAGITRESAQAAGETSRAVQDLVSRARQLDSAIDRFRT